MIKALDFYLENNVGVKWCEAEPCKWKQNSLIYAEYQIEV